MKWRSAQYLAAILLLLVSFQSYAEEAIASAHPLATNAGLEILSEGGNAFDAAVAISAVLAVVEPYHSGLGGGGFWLLYDAKNKTYHFVDGREKAPLKAHPEMFLDEKGNVIPSLSRDGALAAAIPGEPAALCYLAKHHGKLPLSKTLAPAIHLAKEGFQADARFIAFSSLEDRQKALLRFPASSRVFLKNNRPYQLGESIKQPDLQRTLTRLAEKGCDEFYRGETAKKLVSAVQKAGGIWEMEDLNRYEIKIRKPLFARYHDMKIITAPPPSAGGAILILMLKILEPLPLSSYSKLEWVHDIAESMRLAFWQAGSEIADPDVETISLKKLFTSKNAAYLRALIMPKKAIPSKALGESSFSTTEPGQTTHFAVLDKEGNRVSATLSINYIFGSSFVAEGTGVLLNDEMDDFSVKTGSANQYDLPGYAINAIKPGKRPRSSMTPTFLELPSRFAILGTPGGSRIPGMVLIATLLFNEGAGAISMVSHMRFHHQYLPDELYVEPDAFSPALISDLSQMGYVVKLLSLYYGNMQAISKDESPPSFLAAASDPRGIGLAVVR